MSGSTARLQAITAVNNYKATSAPLNFTEIPARDLFGVNVFGYTAMQERLPKEIYRSLRKTIDAGDGPLDGTAEGRVIGREIEGLDRRRQFYAALVRALVLAW